MDVVEKVKYLADKFFTVTESDTFHKYFTKMAWPLARAAGFAKRHVEAAYKLLTRPFWIEQYWFFKWVFTLGPIQSIKKAGGGADFERAESACEDLVGTVDLGGAVMKKFRTFPNVVAAGVALSTGARIAKPGCALIGTLAKLKIAYDKVAWLMNKFGISMPFASGIENHSVSFSLPSAMKKKGKKLQKPKK
jgi:hypothetical protein